MPKRHIWDPIKEGRALVQRLASAQGGAYLETQLRARWENYAKADFDRLRQERDILSWKIDKGEWNYPVWQFLNDGKVEPVIKGVLKIFQSDDYWRIMGYFLQPKKSLNGKRPLEVLREGNGGLVINHAHYHKEEDNW